MLTEDKPRQMTHSMRSAWRVGGNGDSTVSADSIRGAPSVPKVGVYPDGSVDAGGGESGGDAGRWRGKRLWRTCVEKWY